MQKKFTDSFADFDDVLRNKLITGMETVQVSKEEAVIGDDIFARLADVPLVDKYAAYQILDDNWNTIAMDFDVILTEGKDAVRGVDPNMVVKKDKEDNNGNSLPLQAVTNEAANAVTKNLNPMQNENEVIKELIPMILELGTKNNKKDGLSELIAAMKQKRKSNEIKKLHKQA